MLPPWLSITPSDYLRAVEAGTRAGLSIRESSERAFENAQRLQMEAAAQEQRQRQLEIENAANRLSQERLEQYRQGELKNQQERLGIERQGLGLRQEGLTSAEQARELGLGLRERALNDAAERAKASQQAASDRLDLQRQIQDLKQSKEPPPKFVQTQDGLKQYDYATGQLKDPDFAKPEAAPESHGFRDAVKSIGGGLLDRFNIMGIHPFQSSPSQGTNSVGSIPMNPVSTNSVSTSKRRIRVTGPDGQRGTIEEGDDLPEGWTTQQ